MYGIGAIVYVDYKEDDRAEFRFFAEVLGYDEDTERYTLDDVLVIHSASGDYELIENYKMESNNIKHDFKSLEEAKELAPHLFL